MDCKWVYAVKYKADGIVRRYKAELDTKKIHQMYDADRTVLFAPVAKFSST